jgi:hypothetical protein
MTPEQRVGVMTHATDILTAIVAGRADGDTAPRPKPVHVEGGQTYWLTAAEYRRFVMQMRKTGPARPLNRHERRKAAAKRR